MSQNIIVQEEKEKERRRGGGGGKRWTELSLMVMLCYGWRWHEMWLVGALLPLSVVGYYYYYYYYYYCYY